MERIRAPLKISELVRAGFQPNQKKSRHADLIGADLRDAYLSGANLTGSIFLTQAQINAAKGDMKTKLPPLLSHPSHWAAK